MAECLRRLLASKKFAVMLAGLVASVAARFGLPEESAPEVSRSIIAMAGIFVAAQGIADHGKEAQREKNEDATSS